MNNLNYKLIIPAALIVLVIAGAGGYYFYTQKTKVADPNSPQAVQAEVKKVVAEVGKLIELPIGEDPTVATVTDIEKLKDQPFFQKAKNGDKVLIYSNAKKAILYDPKAKKVVDVAPINIGTSSAQTTTAPARVALRNGTTVSGLATKVETEIKKLVPDFNVVEKENAQKQNYDKTIIVIINNAFASYANNLVNSLKGSSIGSLPAEEKNTDADVLIILGKDRTNGS